MAPVSNECVCDEPAGGDTPFCKQCKTSFDRALKRGFRTLPGDAHKECQNDVWIKVKEKRNKDPSLAAEDLINRAVSAWLKRQGRAKSKSSRTLPLNDEIISAKASHASLEPEQLRHVAKTYVRGRSVRAQEFDHEGFFWAVAELLDGNVEREEYARLCRRFFHEEMDEPPACGETERDVKHRLSRDNRRYGRIRTRVKDLRDAIQRAVLFYDAAECAADPYACSDEDPGFPPAARRAFFSRVVWALCLVHSQRARPDELESLARDFAPTRRERELGHARGHTYIEKRIQTLLDFVRTWLPKTSEN